MGRAATAAATPGTFPVRAVLPYGDVAPVLVTEVRLRCTDDDARRASGRYFTVTGPFIKAMGRPVLRLVRNEAERTTETPPSWPPFLPRTNGSTGGDFVPWLERSAGARVMETVQAPPGRNCRFGTTGGLR